MDDLLSLASSGTRPKSSGTLLYKNNIQMSILVIGRNKLNENKNTNIKKCIYVFLRRYFQLSIVFRYEIKYFHPCFSLSNYFQTFFVFFVAFCFIDTFIFSNV